MIEDNFMKESAKSEYFSKNIIDINFIKIAYPKFRNETEEYIIDYYKDEGWLKGIDPNAEFSNELYLNTHPDVREANIDPFEHFINFGKQEGRISFISTWGQDINELINSARIDIVLSKFDPEFYRECNDELKELSDRALVSHYLIKGWKENIDPSRRFSTRDYLNLNDDVAKSGLNPFLHYLMHGQYEDRIAKIDLLTVQENKTTIEENHAHSDNYMIFKENSDGISKSRNLNSNKKLIAFYLPQFHPIKENDDWWGEGFTEWSNVSLSRPLFSGHRQPRLPRKFGFYDVRVPETRNKQFELAKEHGIDGFCYYYYWFNGRKILDRPLNDTLNGKVDPFPFCICWANENWTRRWDGQESDVLLSQDHSLSSDEDFLNDIIPILKNEQYIMYNDMPVLMIYAVQKMADPRQTVKRWREIAREAGFKDLYLIAVQSFGYGDPRSDGFDAAAEFPPHFKYDCVPEEISGSFHNENFSGHVFGYKDVVNKALARTDEPYTLHRAAMCAWDNSPRRKSKATVFFGANAFDYERWLTYILQKSYVNDTMVFVNAWNEWAEGSNIEPDNVFFNSFLLATKRAKETSYLKSLSGIWNKEEFQINNPASAVFEPVLLVGHDAHRNGAQLNLLSFAKELRKQKVPFVILLLGEGVLLDEYKMVGETIVTSSEFLNSSHGSNLLYDLYERGIRRAICNTTVTGKIARTLKTTGYNVVNLIHELPFAIRLYDLQDALNQIADYSDCIVFATKFGRRKIENIVNLNPNKTAILPQGLYNKNIEHSLEDNVIFNNIPTTSKIVIGVGYGDYRKGIDVFVQVARQAYEIDNSIHFIWIGDIESEYLARIREEIASPGWSGNFHMPGFMPVYQALNKADLFLLTSREDPFPSVVLEALAAGLPVIAFQNSGGHVELEDCADVYLVPYLNTASMTTTTITLLNDHKIIEQARKRGPNLIQNSYNFERYVEKINFIATLNPHNKNIGRQAKWIKLDDIPLETAAIIPNYNYDRYLPSRCASVINQSLGVSEIHIFDDASTDNSLEVIKSIKQTDRRIQLHTSSENSGSPFKKWRDGIRASNTELIWIAEADDLCELNFLEALVPHFLDPEVVLAYAHSVPIGENDERLNFNYDDYLSDVDPELWKRSFKMKGVDFSVNFLTSLNTIPNASAVVMRRSAAINVIDEVAEYKACGDWLFYYLMAQQGIVAFHHLPLNYHRRHSHSVISKTERNDIYLDEIFRFANRINSQEVYNPAQISRLVMRLKSEYKHYKGDQHPNRLEDHELFSAVIRNLEIKAGY
jgi:O-antigen biosynthesis protein